MEEARYWMWTKRKNSLSSDQVVASSTKSSTYGDSWEEQAFAEDAAGPLGGCIWPPRSYSCTFCRREFRSAQALGGHMNVHRRDRARLKQSPSPNNHLSSPTASLGIHQYPSQISTFAYGQDSSHGFLASPNSSPSRVSVPLIQVNCNEKALSSPLFSSPFFQEQQKRTSILSPQLWSSMVADRYCNILDLEKEEKNLNFLESKYYRANNKRDYLAADLSVSLNFVVCGNNNQTASSGEEDDSMSFKRRRTDDATVSFFPKQTSAGKSIVHPQSVVEVSPSSKEDLDLELRLGESIHLR